MTSDDDNLTSHGFVLTRTGDNRDELVTSIGDEDILGESGGVGSWKVSFGGMSLLEHDVVTIGLILLEETWFSKICTSVIY